MIGVVLVDEDVIAYTALFKTRRGCSMTGRQDVEVIKQ